MAARCLQVTLPFRTKANRPVRPAEPAATSVRAPSRFAARSRPVASDLIPNERLPARDGFHSADDVGEGDHALGPGILSYRAPILKPLLGKSEGARAVLDMPEGARAYRIASIRKRLPE